ncbi:hypothetical protein F3J14_09130 [Burkholderia sp. Tr-862]|uniref:hypothetical protein n=1 Tax=Burkholderia sp. Tr-862 TaxID=2608331 RepID=UPI0014196759|nr:hypothetical protein [Burkholderia sp. Tr-862]NIF41044.1 hypothetical protein [Burkholderia sp. Tr-862]
MDSGDEATKMYENSPPSTPAVFKAKGAALMAVWLCVVVCIFDFFGSLLIMHGAVLSGVIFIASAFLFFGATAIAIINNWSDVEIDNNAISRRILGSTWQKIDWENVGLITAFPVSGGYGYSARAFNIFPKTRPRFRVLPSGKMVFNDKLNNAEKMIELLNYYASIYGINIKISKTIGGELDSATHL